MRAGTESGHVAINSWILRQFALQIFGSSNIATYLAAVVVVVVVLLLLLLACVLMIDSVMPFRSGFAHGGH